MSEHAPTFKYSNKGQKFAIALLIVILSITIWFGVYNYILSKKVDKMQVTLQEHKDTVKKLKAEKQVYVYELLTLHKRSLDILDKRSQVSDYINHLQEVAQKYNIDFRGFNLSNGSVTTKAQFDTNDTGVSYNKAVRFIGDYRKSDKALFDLEFISSVESTDLDVKIPLQFSIK